MDTKAKVIGAVVVCLLILGGFLWWWNGNSNHQSTIAPKEESGTANSGQNSSDTSMVASIKEAMKLGTAMRCQLSGGTGNDAYQTELIVEGEKFKSTATIGDTMVYGIFDGNTQYTWMSNAKEGMRIEKSCLEKLKNTTSPAGNNTVSQPQDLRESFDAAMNVSCEPLRGEKADFTIPSDVTFTDQCAMMQQTEELMKDLQDKLPAGVTLRMMPSAE